MKTTGPALSLSGVGRPTPPPPPSPTRSTTVFVSLAGRSEFFHDGKRKGVQGVTEVEEEEEKEDLRGSETVCHPRTTNGRFTLLHYIF
ncbi:hypothetical protein M0802_008133 [Mischocyttarus mexicanus]|nr:hypothetical protein M0802_008133 [Mischocyttarus mexicanus]